MYRQGDVLVNPIGDIDCEIEEVKRDAQGRIVLAYGEVTGHAHAIKSMNCMLTKSKNENRFFLIVKKECDLTHEEHSKITLPIGNYEVIRQREYTPQEIRYVAD